MTGREQQLLRSLPDILNYKSIFYIGASQRRVEMIGLFEEKGYDITIMEAWKPNVDALRERFPKIFQGDVRDIDRLKMLPRFDIIMWWHGPEHAPIEELPKILTWLEMKALKIIVVANPWGIYKQGEIDGNPYEVHRASVYAKFYTDLGWRTNVLGKKDTRGSNLLAWKRH